MNSGASTGYDPRSFPPIAVTVDVVLFAIVDGALNILLIERGADPFRRCWALPGGFVQPSDPDLDRAAARELEEETGIGPGAAYLEQLGAYGARDRDPRMRVVSVAYWAACARPPQPTGGSDAARAELVPVSRIEDGHFELAFDHGQIAREGLDRLRAKLEYTALGARFCLPAFTISELRSVYEAVWNTELDAGNFQRKVRFNEPFRQVETRESQAAARLVETWEPSPAPDISLRCAPMAPQRRAPRRRAARRFAESRRPAADGGPPLVRRGRRGRPASLWTVEDPAAMLNLPIARPPSSRRDAG